MSATLKDVRKYYDQNTRLFLTFGRSREANNIHRSLWTDEATTLEQALQVTNERIRLEIESATPAQARIADLGCGVGAGLFYIVPRLKQPAFALGATISPIQAQLAAQYCREMGLQNTILFAESDFTSVPLANSVLDAVYSVEAVVHAAEPERYFHEAGRLLRSGGKLIMVDDFKASHALSQPEQGWLKAFMDGWHVPGVQTVDQMLYWAGQYQLQITKNENLTPYLRLRNLPDSLARVIHFAGKHLPIHHAILPSMLGSMALQQCLHQGIVEYRLLVFERM